MGISMDMNSIASMVEGGAGLAEGIRGYFQGKEGKEEMDALMANFPELKMQTGYQNALKTIQSLAGGKIPGYYTQLGNIDATTGQSIGAAKEGAMSSAQLQDTLGKLNQQSLQAKSQLDIASGQYQADALKALAGAQNQMGDLQTKQWDQNINRLWNLKMKQTQAQKDQSYESIWSGLDTFLASSEKFAGSTGGGDLSSMFG